MKQTYLLLLPLFLALACLPLGGAHPEGIAAPPAELHFGQGGGFTGKQETHLLTRKGQLTHISELTRDTTSLPAIKRSEARKLFRQWDALGLADTTISHPGNAYYFIVHIEKGDTTRVVWGAPGHEPPAGAEALYKALRGIVPKRQAPEK